MSFQANSRFKKVALVHYWLVGMRGGERVLEEFCDIFPDADIFTLVVDPEHLSSTIKQHKIITSFLQKIGGKRHYKKLLPLMPFALEAFDLSEYDLVISSEAGPAKGIITRPDALHICYCHSPMRYIWDLYPEYYSSSGQITRAVMSITSPFLRAWDVTTSSRVDYFIANSTYVAKRIEKFYRRSATVIYPPIDTSRFSTGGSPSEHYICAGQITPYKKIEIAVDAFTRMGKPLIIIGGPVTERLRRAAGPSVQFIGSVSDEIIAQHFSNCKALVFPGVEDFGIIPVEVMASGRPVIAFARGGATETVIEGKTGILFHEQSADALIGAVNEMEIRYGEFSPNDLRSFSQTFDKAIFKKKIEGFIDQILEPGKG